MIKTILPLILCFPLLFSCIKKQEKSGTKNSIDPCKEDVFSCFQVKGKSGFDADDSPYTVPLAFVFINSSERNLSFNPQLDAQRVENILNDAFTDQQGYRHLQFKTISVEHYTDDELFNASCSDLEMAMARYGEKNAKTLIFNQNLESSCSGVAYLWTRPNSYYSGALIQYKAALESIGEVIAHEIGHNLGLHHSAKIYEGSAPLVGVADFNELLTLGEARSEHRCEENFSYFIDYETESVKTNFEGVVFNSYENLMYPGHGDGIKRSFFTEGYESPVFKAFGCWYNFAKDF